MTESGQRLRNHWRDPDVFIVCGFGSGFAPKAPGTFGSALAVLIWWLWLAPLNPVLQLAVIVLVVLVGTGLVSRVQRRLSVTDPGAIVVDEFAGQWIVLFMAPADPISVLAGFVLFRLFDIYKPWPVNWLERHVSGAFGVMVDDLAAGLMGLTVLQFTFLLVRVL
jgi:phosphatidylglycerophosphatase A